MCVGFEARTMEIGTILNSKILAAGWKDLEAVLHQILPESKVKILDLRPVTELSKSVPDLPEAWHYRRVPLRGCTISEQDFDILRRSIHKASTLVLLCTEARRAELVALAFFARQQRRTLSAEEVERLGLESEEDQALLNWLIAYLERHSGTELNEEFVL